MHQEVSMTVTNGNREYESRLEKRTEDPVQTKQ